MKHKFRIEITFFKNRHYPEFGKNAYNIETYVITIPYGKGNQFKNKKAALNFVRNIITKDVLDHYDRISISSMVGYSGTVEYLKESKEKSDSNPIDILFIENIFNI